MMFHQALTVHVRLLANTEAYHPELGGMLLANIIEGNFRIINIAYWVKFLMVYTQIEDKQTFPELQSQCYNLSVL